MQLLLLVLETFQQISVFHHRLAPLLLQKGGFRFGLAVLPHAQRPHQMELCIFVVIVGLFHIAFEFFLSAKFTQVWFQYVTLGLFRGLSLKVSVTSHAW